jgi:MFS family permease
LYFLPDFKWDLSIKKELSMYKFNWSTLLQGMSSKINFNIIPIFTLFFITTPRQFGNFFGYLALVTAVASLINGYFSDKIKSRKYFFYFLSIVAVLSFLPLAFAKDSYTWAIFVGISSLCIYLANPFWFAFNIDYYKEVGIEKTIILREVYLNSGYILNFIIVFSVFYFTNSTKISLIVISIVCCILPIASYFQGVYLNEKNA